jgi:hypothetical protein
MLYVEHHIPSLLITHYIEILTYTQSTAMVLALALHKRYTEMDSTYDPINGHILPSFPLHRSRFIMTRSDFIRKHHDLSIFSIDSHAMVRADSVPMQRAFNEICSEPGFEAFLDATLERIGAIESLARTKELTFKDLWEGGKYRITTRDTKGREQGVVEIETVAKESEEEEEKEKEEKVEPDETRQHLTPPNYRPS